MPFRWSIAYTIPTSLLFTPLSLSAKLQGSGTCAVLVHTLTVKIATQRMLVFVIDVPCKCVQSRN